MWLRRGFTNPFTSPLRIHPALSTESVEFNFVALIPPPNFQVLKLIIGSNVNSIQTPLLPIISHPFPPSLMSMCLIRLRRGRIFRQRGICAPRESSSRCRVSKLILSPSKLATVWGDWTASVWCVPSVLLRLTDENLRQGGTAFTTSAAQGRLFICAVSFDRTESKWWHNFNLSVNTACHFYFLDRSAKWVTNVVETTDTRGIWRLRRQHLNRGTVHF